MDNETEERVQRLLGGTGDEFMRHSLKSLSKLRKGQRGILADNVDRRVTLVEVTDAARDGNFSVFAFEPVFGSRSWLKWTRRLRGRLAQAGLGSNRKSPRTRWISAMAARSLGKAMYPRRTKDW